MSNTTKTPTTKKVGLLITHEVKNYATWKTGFDAHESTRATMGVKVTGVYTSVDNENLVTVTSEVPSLEAATGFINDPKMKETMEKSGVISSPEFKIVTIQN